MKRTIAPTVDFSTQIEHLNQEMSSARSEHARLSLELAENPADANLNAQLDQLDREIDGYGRKITRLQIARQEAERRDSAEARTERLKLAQDQHKRLTASGTKLSKLAQDLERALGQIAPLLAQWQSLSEDRASDLYAIMREVAPGKSAEPLLKSARANDGVITTALARLVAATGIGRTGPDLDPYVLVTEPNAISKNVPLVDALAAANNKLVSILGDLIDQHAQKLGAK